MSREIKFRAWDGEKIQTNFYLQADGTRNRDVSNWTYMQYTGLKDKNGVEIYEGDIVDIYRKHSDRNPQRFYPTRDMAKKVSWRVTSNSIGWNIRGGDNTQIEVIGNIYENPELLKVHNNDQ